MKIKLAILYPNKKYLNKIVAAFNNRYADQLEIYSYTDQEVALENIRKNRIRVFLAGENCEIDPMDLDRCGFAYLTESRGTGTCHGQRAVCMYLKTEEIYQNIVDIFTSVGGEWGSVDADGSCNVIAFCSAGGGVGASSMAAACAVHAAARHKKVLYLNLENFGDAQQYFTAEGQYGMSDVIYAVKGRKTALRGKLVSHVRHDANGVYFYAAPQTPLHMTELTEEEIILLLTELKKNNDYECIVLDMDFDLSNKTIQIFRECGIVVLVGDGSESSNKKTEGAYRALEAIEQSREISLVDRLCIAYNRGNSKTAKDMQLPSVRVLGKYPVIAGASAAQVVQTLAQSDMFDQIL